MGSAFIKKLFGSGEPVVAGVRYVVIETKNDEVVTPYTNAFLSGSNVLNITIQNQCPSDPVAHIGMFDDSPSLQNVLNQLSQAPNESFKATCSNYGQGICNGPRPRGSARELPRSAACGPGTLAATAA